MNTKGMQRESIMSKPQSRTCTLGHTQNKNELSPSVNQALINEPGQLPFRQNCVLKVQATVLIDVGLPHIWHRLIMLFTLVPCCFLKALQFVCKKPQQHVHFNLIKKKEIFRSNAIFIGTLIKYK